MNVALSTSPAGDNNQFALDVYGRLHHQPGNVFFSPFSVRSALAIVLAGAGRATAAQMAAALRFPSSGEEPHAALAAMVERLDAGGRGAYEMTIANSLWGQAGTPYETAFLEFVTRHYGAAMHIVDFRRRVETARAEINEWIANKTNRRIRDLISPGSLSVETRLVVANAVYFKGKWQSPFSQKATREGPFTRNDGTTVRVPLMSRNGLVRYADAPTYQGVELDYEGSDVSMLVVLPRRSDGLGDLERMLSTATLDDCARALRPRLVSIVLPRFHVSWGTVDVGPRLVELGMTDAFDRGRADFSAINGRVPPDEHALFISAVLHKAFVDVNEEGTEAAAATAVVMRTLGAADTPELFRADHAFLFAIRERKTGTILFLGRVADPTI